MTRVYLDFETRSEIDLKKTGAVTYAQHPTTEVVCLSWKEPGCHPGIWYPGTEFPRRFIALLKDPTVVWVAHNALFEYVIYNYVLRARFLWLPDLAPSRFDCTAAKAAACALPRNLEGAALALKLPVQKDMGLGSKLMKKYMKPRPAWKKSGTGDKYFSDPEELNEIYKYCRTDVTVTELLDNRLPDLIPFERKIWLMNIRMNLHGVRVDVRSAKKIQEWIGLETDRLNRELTQITYGEVTSANKREPFLNWLRSEGLTIGNLQAGTVTELLAAKNPRGVYVAIGPARRALTIRQAVGRSALKKYPAMLKRVSRDGRVKDYSLYHGASTGREAGRGLQLQNIVKGKIKNTDLAIDLINTSSLEEIQFLYGDAFEVFSSCVRGMVTADEGQMLYAADYSAIEARVLAWMCDNKTALHQYLNNIDSYKIMAAKIFGCSVEKVTYDQREVGKRVVLGCGFGMGHKKFFETCVKYKVKGVSEALAKRAVSVYRSTHEEVPSMWGDIESAAINATLKPGRTFTTCRTSWEFSKGFLWCTLPSGRKLAYYGPSIKSEMKPWGEPGPTLFHWGSNPVTKKWEKSSTYGGRLVENCVQGCARDIMVNGNWEARFKGYQPLFNVHDEIVAQKKNGNLEEYVEALTKLPEWAKGLPVKAKGWEKYRYRKE
jgi:DNA polymerase